MKVAIYPYMVRGLRIDGNFGFAKEKHFDRTEFSAREERLHLREM